MSPLVQGHEIDGIPLCTPSVWADIALTLGNYFLQRYRPGHTKNVVDVTDMTILKALILRHGSTKQLVQVHSEVDWSSDSAKIKFMSFDVSFLRFLLNYCQSAHSVQIEQTEIAGACQLQGRLQGRSSPGITPEGCSLHDAEDPKNAGWNLVWGRSSL